MPKPTEALAYGSLVTAALVWGGSIVGQKWALGSFSAVETSVLRGIGALGILIPLWWWQEGKAVRFSGRDIAIFTALGLGVLGNHLGVLFGLRYIGSFVADFHRTLLQGGIFMYPSEREKPAGKLRLLYEAAPIAMIAEQAGGRASTGLQDLVDVVPESLHQRTPVYVGSADFVDLAEGFLRESSEI